MASMSYCVFQNTSIDMAQCVGQMSEAVDDGMSLEGFIADRSRDEGSYVTRLVKQARELIELYEQLEGVPEEE